MNRFLEGLLRILSLIILIGGPLLAVAVGVTSFVSPFIGAAGGALSVYLLFLSLLFGGGLRLLLSIDDRLERLEGTQ